LEKKLNGIVLKSVNYGENDAILNIFTLEEGIISAKIKGVKKASAKLKFASQPFCFAEFIIAEKGDKKSVINASLHDGFYSLRENFYAFYAGSTMLEFALKFLSQSVENKEMFLLLSKSLNELTYGKESTEKVLIKFLLKALSLSGYGLYFDRCVKCGCEISGRVFFSVQTGAFACEECLEEGFEIYFNTYLALKNIEKEDFDKEHLINGLKLISYYLRERAEVEIKSLKEFIEIEFFNKN